MNTEPEKVPVNKTSLWMMIALIVVLLIGIATRWSFIKKEVADTFGRYFQTEQADSSASGLAE